MSTPANFHNYNVRSEEVRKMGNYQLAERCVPPFRDGEVLANIIRSNNHRKKMPDYQDRQGDHLLKEPPIIGVVLSGGGWRSMEASTNFMDTLRLSGVLSHVSVVAGLSGGSWTCVLGAMSGGYNHLYGGMQQEWGTPPRYGEGGIVSDFDTLMRGDDATKAMLTTLRNMLSVDRAEEAAKAPGRGSISSLFEHFKDVLVSVGRLAAKVAYDEHLPHLMALMSANPTQAYLYNYSRILDSQFFGPLHTRVNREDAVFCQAESDDILPLMVVAATSFARFPEPPTHKHDWFEFDAVTRYIDVPSSSGVLQSQSVVGGGLRECTPMACRMALPNLQIRFSQHGSQPFYKELTAPIIMAIGGCALDDNARKMMKGVDKDCFTGHIFDCTEHFYQQQELLQSEMFESTSCVYEQADPIEPRPVGQLYDAGISCNVPLQLAHGRCNIAFVLDNSHNEKASEELAVAVCKGYYHIHVPGEKLRKHKNSSAPKEDEEEYTPPKPTNDKTASKSSKNNKQDLENEKFEGLIEGHKIKNPEEAAFLQNHVHRWITKDPHSNEFVESQDVVRIFLPKKGYSKAVWGPKSGPHDREDEPILIYLRGLRTESTFRMDRTPQEIKENHVYMTKIAAIGIKALEFIVKQQNVIPKAGYWTQDIILADYALLRETVAQPLAPPRTLMNKVFSLLTIIPPFKFVYNLVLTQLNKLSASTRSQLKMGRQLLSIGVLDNRNSRDDDDAGSGGSSGAGTPTNAALITRPTLKSFHPALLSSTNSVSESSPQISSPHHAEMLRSGSTSIVAIPSSYRRTSSGNTASQSILPSPYSPCASFRAPRPSPQQRITSPTLARGANRSMIRMSSSTSVGGWFQTGTTPQQRVSVPSNPSSAAPSPYSSHRPPSATPLPISRYSGGGASSGMQRAPSSPIMPLPYAFPTVDAATGAASSTFFSGRASKTNSATVITATPTITAPNPPSSQDQSSTRAQTASPPRRFTGVPITIHTGQSVKQSVGDASPLLSRNNTLDVRGSPPHSMDDTADPKSILKENNEGYKNVANNYWNDPSFKMCVDALFWVLETLRAMKAAEAGFRRGRFNQSEAAKIVIFPSGLHKNGDDELMQFKCLAASLLADEDLLDEFGHLTALLRLVIRTHRPKDLHPDAPHLHTKLDEIVAWADNYELELIENAAKQREMAEKRKRELREKLCSNMGAGFKDLVCGHTAPTAKAENNNNEKGKNEQQGVNGGTAPQTVRRAAAPTSTLPPWITQMDASHLSSQSAPSPTFNTNNSDIGERSSDLPPLHPIPHSPHQQERWGELSTREPAVRIAVDQTEANREEKTHQQEDLLTFLNDRIASLQVEIRSREDFLDALQDDFHKLQRRLVSEEDQRLRASLDTHNNTNNNSGGGRRDGGFASVCSDFNMDMEANASSSYSRPPRVPRMKVLPDDATVQEKIRVKKEHIEKIMEATRNLEDEISTLQAKKLSLQNTCSNNNNNESNNVGHITFHRKNSLRGQNAAPAPDRFHHLSHQQYQHVLMNLSTSSTAHHPPPRNMRSNTLTPPTVEGVEKLKMELLRAQSYLKHLQCLFEQKNEMKRQQCNNKNRGLNSTTKAERTSSASDRQRKVMTRSNNRVALLPPRIVGSDDDCSGGSTWTSLTTTNDDDETATSSSSSTTTASTVSSSGHMEDLISELRDQEEKVHHLQEHCKMAERHFMNMLQQQSFNNNTSHAQHQSPTPQPQLQKQHSFSSHDEYQPPRRQDSRVHFKGIEEEDENEELNSSNRKAATSSEGDSVTPTHSNSAATSVSNQCTPSCNTTLESTEGCGGGPIMVTDGSSSDQSANLRLLLAEKQYQEYQETVEVKKQQQHPCSPHHQEYTAEEEEELIMMGGTTPPSPETMVAATSTSQPPQEKNKKNNNTKGGRGDTTNTNNTRHPRQRGKKGGNKQNAPK